MASRETRRFRTLESLGPLDRAEVEAVLEQCISTVVNSHEVDDAIDLSEYTAKYSYRKAPALRKDCVKRGLKVGNKDEMVTRLAEADRAAARTRTGGNLSLQSPPPVLAAAEQQAADSAAAEQVGEQQCCAAEAAEKKDEEVEVESVAEEEEAAVDVAEEEEVVVKLESVAEEEDALIENVVL